jgi:hypothetical protein
MVPNSPSICRCQVQPENSDSNAKKVFNLVMQIFYPWIRDSSESCQIVHVCKGIIYYLSGKPPNKLVPELIII